MLLVERPGTTHHACLTLFLLLLAVNNKHITEASKEKGGTSSNITGTGGAKDMSRLMSDLLADYDPAAWPRLNSSSPIYLKVGLGVLSLINLDTRQQMISLRGYVRTLWNDPYLQWNPEDYGNITYIVLAPKSIWIPDLTLANSLRDIFLGSDETYVAVDYNGTVDWQPSVVSDFTCEVDVAKFPLDINICPIFVTSWMYDIRALKFTLMEPHTVLDRDLRNGQFNIEVDPPVAENIPYDAKIYSTVVFNLKISRMPEYTFLSLVFPMVAIGLLSPLSFLIPPDSGEKVGVSLNVLLSTTVCVGLVRGDLPDRSDRISSVAVYAVSILVSAFISVMGNIVVLLVYRYEIEHHQPEVHVNSTANIDGKRVDDNGSTGETRIRQSLQYNAKEDIQKPPLGRKPNGPVRDWGLFGGQHISLAWKLNWFFFGIVSMIGVISLSMVLGMICS